MSYVFCTLSSVTTAVHDAFISYSRKDKDFALRLERALESWSLPKGLDVPQRRLDIFRDEADMTGGEYHSSIQKHVKESRKLIVLCSPAARASAFVNEEIRQFAQLNGAGGLIPLLISGIPNNQAKPGEESSMAFPEALCEVMDMPLATSFAGFNLLKKTRTLIDRIV